MLLGRRMYVIVSGLKFHNIIPSFVRALNVFQLTQNLEFFKKNMGSSGTCTFFFQYNTEKGPKSFPKVEV
jgi:hypothetical protein